MVFTLWATTIIGLRACSHGKQKGATSDNILIYIHVYTYLFFIGLATGAYKQHISLLPLAAPCRFPMWTCPYSYLALFGTVKTQAATQNRPLRFWNAGCYERSKLKIQFLKMSIKDRICSIAVHRSQCCQSEPSDLEWFCKKE